MKAISYIRRLGGLLRLTAGAALLCTFSAANSFAQTFDDDIYYNPSKQKKEQKTKSKAATTTSRSTSSTQSATARYSGGEGASFSYTPVYSDSPADAYSFDTGNSRNVDEYNRRTNTPDAVAAQETVLPEDYSYTQRIERFYNPDIVASSNDEALKDSYYQAISEPATTVNIYVNEINPYYYGRYYRPSSWLAYNSYWAWADPFYYWGPSWSFSWGWGPDWGWGPSWSLGWAGICPPYHHHHHFPIYNPPHRPGVGHGYRPPVGAMATHRPAAGAGHVGASPSHRPSVVAGSSTRPAANFGGSYGGRRNSSATQTHGEVRLPSSYAPAGNGTSSKGSGANSTSGRRNRASSGSAASSSSDNSSSHNSGYSRNSGSNSSSSSWGSSNSRRSSSSSGSSFSSGGHRSGGGGFSGGGSGGGGGRRR